MWLKENDGAAPSDGTISTQFYMAIALTPRVRGTDGSTETKVGYSSTIINDYCKGLFRNLVRSISSIGEVTWGFFKDISRC